MSNEYCLSSIFFFTVCFPVALARDKRVEYFRLAEGVYAVVPARYGTAVLQRHLVLQTIVDVKIVAGLFSWNQKRTEVAHSKMAVLMTPASKFLLSSNA